MTIRKTTAPKSRAKTLRQKAEKKLHAEQEHLAKLSTAGLKKLVHELGTHQIELEMQNEELRRAQTELDTAHRKYADLYDFSPVGYVTLDKSGLIQEVNDTGAKMLGKAKRILIGKPFQTFIAPDNRVAFRGHLAEVLETELRRTCELTLQGMNGVSFPVQLQSIAAYSEDEAAKSCRIAVSDISERKQAEEKLAALHEDLEKQYAELLVANKQLDAYSYAISHDLKAPLRHIEGFIQALSDEYSDLLDEKGRDYLHRVTAGAEQMKNLIDALLGLSRVSRSDLNRSKVYLSALVRASAEELAKTHPERKAKFVIADNITAAGDRVLLRAAIDNLLGNAWKFSAKQHETRIEFGVTQIDGNNAYFVRDNGAGFDMQYKDKLFIPFQRLHGGAEFPGVGIGLSLVHRIVQRHGGKVWAEGETDKGATFYFTLG